MIQIRHGVFETNSSSTHSMVVCSDEDLAKWEKGELLYDYEELVPSEGLSEDEKEDYKTLEQFMDCDWLESGHETHTTPSGDKVNIIYTYGHD